MQYTAMFTVKRELDDMFQSINGDVWQTIAVHATPNPRQEKRYACVATVKRIWVFKASDMKG